MTNQKLNSETKKVKQIHSEISKFKTNCYHHIVNHKEINLKNKQLETEQLLNQTFSPETIKQKPSKFQYYVVYQLKNLMCYLNAYYLKAFLNVLLEFLNLLLEYLTTAKPNTFICHECV